MIIPYNDATVARNVFKNALITKAKPEVIIPAFINIMVFGNNKLTMPFIAGIKLATHLIPTVAAETVIAAITTSHVLFARSIIAVELVS